MDANALPSIDAIIVNFRTAPFVAACLHSLARERRNVPGLRVIVVDNASGDGSAEQIDALIQAQGWDWVTLIRSPINGGFGAGNNIGICRALAREAPADLLWLLNPDTEVREGAGLALARFMAAHPNAGVAGSALLEGDGTPWPYAFRFPTILGEIERAACWRMMSILLRSRTVLRAMGNRSEPADWVSGASFVIRRAVVDSGLRFDETFFLYYEETDFCLHARKMGWECWYVPDAVVLHIAGQSTGVTGRQITLRRLPAYWFNSRRYYFVKNHGRLYGMLADLGWVCGHCVATVKRLIRGVPSTDPPRLLLDFIRHSSLVPRRLFRG